MKTKLFTIACAFLTLVACAESDSKNEAPPVQSNVLVLKYIGTTNPVNGPMGSDSRLEGVVLTLDKNRMNETMRVQDLIGEQFCNDSSRLTPNEATISSNTGVTGTIKFSALQYGPSKDNVTDQTCYLFNNEEYTFVLSGNKLYLMARAIGKSWDRATSVFEVK